MARLYFCFLTFLLPSLFSTCLLSPFSLLQDLPNPVTRAIFKVQAPNVIWTHICPCLPHSTTWEPRSLPHTLCFWPCFSLISSASAFPLPSSPTYSSGPPLSMKVSLCSVFKITAIRKHCDCECLSSIPSVLGHLFALYH